MEFFQEFIQEGLNGLSASSIKVYLIQLFLCGFVGLVSAWIYAKKFKSKLDFPLTGVSLAFGIIVPFVKYSTPLALVTVAICLLFTRSLTFKRSSLPYVLVPLLAVVGIAAGFYVFTLIGWFVATVYLLLSKVLNED